MFYKIKITKTILHYKSYHSIGNVSWENFKKLPHRKKMELYLNSMKHLKDAKDCIPSQYLEPSRRSTPKNLYLVDSQIAQNIAERILPMVSRRQDPVICETNAGLGYLTSELLNGGLSTLRIYESCSDFRQTLKRFTETLPRKIDLFDKDLFHMYILSYIDKMNSGKRVEQMLNGICRRKWTEEPIMTIIGAMPKLNFMNYVIKMIALQHEVGIMGRIELFAVITPGDYLRLTAGPHLNLHTYRAMSVLYNIFCKTTLLDKFPRIAFLPWGPTINVHSRTQVTKKYDMDNLYLVHIEFNKDLPLTPDQYLPFYFFVRQLFGRGSIQIISKMEKWVSDIGVDIILPKEKYNLTKDIGIHTITGELTPLEILQVFKIMYDHPTYANSPFIAMVDSELVKCETVETSITDAKRKIKKQ